MWSEEGYNQSGLFLNKSKLQRVAIATEMWVIASFFQYI